MQTPIRYAIAAVAVLLCHIIVSALIRRYGWRKENFRKERISSVFGLYIVAYGAIGAVLARYTRFGSDPAARFYLIAILGFGLLGLADDLLGSKDTGGFRGHFKKLLFEGNLTTGAVKAIGGGLIAIYLGYETSGGNVGLWALDTTLIALAANTVNLFDLRPGRAIFVFYLGIIIVAFITWGSISAPVPLIAIALVTAGVAWYDCRGKAMLGDVGSNTLGAVLGLTIALDAPLVGKITLAVIFLAINVISERWSISGLIERHPALKYIDSKLGVR